MKRTTKVRALWKCALPVIAFLGAGLLTACDKEPKPIQEPSTDEPVVVVPEPNPYDGPMDSIKVLTYTSDNVDSLKYNIVMQYANDPRITRIIYFLDSANFGNDCRHYGRGTFHGKRIFMEKCINYAPTKAVGAGTYVIYPGRIYPDDSMWIITLAWKIKSSERY